MNESIGGSILLNIVIIIVGALIAVFTASFAYSKAFKAKNIIIDTINDYDGDITHSISYSHQIIYEEDEIIKEIDNQLDSIGYRKANIKCNNRHNGELVYPSEPYSETSTSLYYRKNKGYCIYRIKETNSMGSESYYYEVETYMYFDIPLFDFKIPVYGQTKSYQPNPKNILEDEEETTDIEDTDDI